jgi:hypothetical protein
MGERRRMVRSATFDPSGSAGLGIPNLPAAKAENSASCTASSATQCRSNPVSGRNLPKTGVFQMSAGDYRLFTPRMPKIGARRLVAS